MPDHAFPPSNSSHHQALAAKNVQRGLAAKVQELSGTFRKKQRVYMESEFRCILPTFSFIMAFTCPSSPRCWFSARSLSIALCSTPSRPSSFAELQGHAIKNQDLLIASGAISLKGSEGLSAVDEDVAAVAAVRGSSLIQTASCRITSGRAFVD